MINPTTRGWGVGIIVLSIPVHLKSIALSIFDVQLQVSVIWSLDVHANPCPCIKVHLTADHMSIPSLFFSNQNIRNFFKILHASLFWKLFLNDISNTTQYGDSEGLYNKRWHICIHLKTLFFFLFFNHKWEWAKVLKYL